MLLDEIIAGVVCSVGWSDTSSFPYDPVACSVGRSDTSSFPYDPAACSVGRSDTSSFPYDPVVCSVRWSDTSSFPYDPAVVHDYSGQNLDYGLLNETARLLYRPIHWTTVSLMSWTDDFFIDALLQFANVFFCTEIAVEKHFDPLKCDFWRALAGLKKNFLGLVSLAIFYGPS